MRKIVFMDNRGLAEQYQNNWNRMKEDLDSSKILCLDVETSGLDPYTERLLLVQLTRLNGDAVWVFPFQRMAPLERDYLLDLISSKELVIHNAAFDLRFLTVHLGLDLLSEEYTVFDTYVAEQVLGAGTFQNLRAYASLAATIKRRLGQKMDKDVRREFIGHHGNLFTPAQIEYAAKDIMLLPEIRRQQIEEAATHELTATLKLEFDLVKVVTKMHLDGVSIDQNLWREILKEEEDMRDEAYEELCKMIEPYIKQQTLFGDSAVNVKSSAQLLRFLNKDYGLDIADTAEATLKAQDDPICKAVLEYRGHEKMLNAFGESTLKRINPTTNRLHAEFNQCMTATGRFSSDSPNVQQIPSKGAGARLRKCFVAAPGCSLVCADYSQIELRILAEFSGEPKLIEAYTNEIDIHTQTASVAFGIPVDLVTSDQRKIAKILNFATCYGGGPAAVSRGLIQVISEEEATAILHETFHQKIGPKGPYYTLGLQFVKAFFEGMPTAKDYLENSGMSAVYNRYSETPLGRKRFYRELDEYPTPGDEMYKELVSSVSRRGRNHPIQGCSADITKLALVGISREFRKQDWGHEGKILLQVHDEIVVEVPAEHAEEGQRIVLEQMEIAGTRFLKLVPVNIESKISDHWEK